MTDNDIKILFFSDSHLGFDFPVRPRVQRRRRGHDFFANYHRILRFAQTNQVDLIIHGGDVFFRSKIPPSIIDKALEPLAEVANAGIPVYLVPGNHERSKLPGHLWLAHSNIHVFDRPKTYRQKVGSISIAISGFPFVRKIKRKFRTLLQQTNYQNNKTDIHFLCLHQTFEGAQVGPSDFTFKISPDNIPPSEIPDGFTVILAGHIHRGQQLTQTLDKQPIAAPIVYSGSIERTSFAERFEEKYFVVINIQPGLKKLKPSIKFHRLPTRPMVKIEIPTWGKSLQDIKDLIGERISSLTPDSIVRVQLTGSNADSFRKSLSASFLRSVSPSTMNVSLGYDWKIVNQRQ